MLINWTVLILYNYFNAMFVGPGYIPLEWKPVSLFWAVSAYYSFWKKSLMLTKANKYSNISYNCNLK